MRSHALIPATLVVLFALSGNSVAQPLSHPRLSLTPQKNILNSSLQSFTSNGTIRTLVVGGLLTGLATRYDYHSAAAFHNSPGAVNSVLDLGDDVGNGKYLMALSAAAWGAGALFHGDNVKETGKSLVVGLAADVALVTSIKLLTRRERPDGTDLQSFPSGHTSGAFTAATVLSRRHGWRLGLPAYALASVTAMNRMEDRRHFASDVVAGAVLGIVIGRAVTASADQSESRLKVVPSGLGAKLTLSF